MQKQHDYDNNINKIKSISKSHVSHDNDELPSNLRIIEETKEVKNIPVEHKVTILDFKNVHDEHNHLLLERNNVEIAIAPRGMDALVKEASKRADWVLYNAQYVVNNERWLESKKKDADVIAMKREEASNERELINNRVKEEKVKLPPLSQRSKERCERSNLFLENEFAKIEYNYIIEKNEIRRKLKPNNKKMTLPNCIYMKLKNNGLYNNKIFEIGDIPTEESGDENNLVSEKNERNSEKNKKINYNDKLNRDKVTVNNAKTKNQKNISKKETPRSVEKDKKGSTSNLKINKFNIVTEIDINSNGKEKKKRYIQPEPKDTSPINDKQINIKTRFKTTKHESPNVADTLKMDITNKEGDSKSNNLQSKPKLPENVKHTSQNASTKNKFEKYIKKKKKKVDNGVTSDITELRHYKNIKKIIIDELKKNNNQTTQADQNEIIDIDKQKRIIKDLLKRYLFSDKSAHSTGKLTGYNSDNLNSDQEKNTGDKTEDSYEKELSKSPGKRSPSLKPILLTKSSIDVRIAKRRERAESIKMSGLSSETGYAKVDNNTNNKKGKNTIVKSPPFAESRIIGRQTESDHTFREIDNLRVTASKETITSNTNKIVKFNEKTLPNSTGADKNNVFESTVNSNKSNHSMRFNSIRSQYLEEAKKIATELEKRINDNIKKSNDDNESNNSS